MLVVYNNDTGTSFERLSDCSIVWSIPYRSKTKKNDEMLYTTTGDVL